MKTATATARRSVVRTKPETKSALPPTLPPTTNTLAHKEEPRDPRKLAQHLKSLRLPTMREEHQRLADLAAREQWTHLRYLAELTERECQTRNQNRVAKLLRSARLLPGKTWEQFRWSRLPLTITQQFETLRSGEFLDRRDNLLIFGSSGTGKTNLLCALGEQLTQRGRALLFTLLAERYERGSVLISSNLKFSKWDQIFKDPLTTQAAIDRVIHHSVIIELNTGSVRFEEAKERLQQSGVTVTTNTTTNP